MNGMRRRRLRKRLAPPHSAECAEGAGRHRLRGALRSLRCISRPFTPRPLLRAPIELPRHRAGRDVSASAPLRTCALRNSATSSAPQPPHRLFQRSQATDGGGKVLIRERGIVGRASKTSQ
ncbi:hypothetical protein K1T71_006045 [Dendrolimus kikuchii]|uniref:Uncharacterized protein n=1 Tax=Dendrolimus kikuchii TaxID=765133 RepID=A0ACC1D4A0_9NEOP|nr:hypothetical protein K1T71_006045 [Dendrolimus kikuchii]